MIRLRGFALCPIFNTPPSSFAGKIQFMKVTLGVSGGIAAYKAAELVRALQQQALDVHVVMTESAQQFVQPLTFASITGHKVITSLWALPESPDDNLASAI